MKKEPLNEKLIKRIYGISGPLDEHKRREAEHIGNKIFMILFYLMIFGNLIPLGAGRKRRRSAQAHRCCHCQPAHGQNGSGCAAAIPRDARQTVRQTD